MGARHNEKRPTFRQGVFAFLGRDYPLTLSALFNDRHQM